MRWAKLICGGALAILLIVLLARAREVMAVVHANADLSAPLVMGDVAHRYEDAQLVTGRLGWWGGLWIVQLLRPLPGGLWLAGWLPLIASIAAAGAVAWQARRVWSDLSGVVVAAVALAMGQGAWAYQAAWSARAPSWWAMALMGIAAVSLAGSARRPRAGTLALCAVAVVAVAVAGSGDQLALVGGAAPLAAGAAYAAWRRRPALAAGLVGLGGASWLLALAVAALADSAGYLRQDFPVELVAPDQLGVAFDGLVQAGRLIWASPPAGAGRLAGDVGLALVVIALVGGLATLVAAAGRRPAPEEAELDLRRGVWTSFWTTALIAYLLAFWLTQSGGLAGAPGVRYLYGVPLAAAATLAPLGLRGTGRLVAAGAGVLALLTAAVLLAQPPKVPAIQGDLSRTALFSTIERVARQEGVTRGFAGYWTSYPLVLHSGRTLDVTPVGTCGTTEAPELCPMYLHYVDQAYAPQPGIRSFLLVDLSPLAGAGFSGAWAQRLPTSMQPAKIVDVGDGMQMAIFDHDVAADLLPNGGMQDPRVGRGGPLAPR